MPKTVTRQPAPATRRGGPSKPPPACSTRSASTTTASTPSSRTTLPYLASLGTPIIVSIAGRTHDEFVEMAGTTRAAPPGVAAIELNISCPNVSGGVDFGTDPAMCERRRAPVRARRAARRSSPS